MCSLKSANLTSLKLGSNEPLKLLMSISGFKAHNGLLSLSHKVMGLKPIFLRFELPV